MSVSGNPGTSVLFHRLGIWRCDRYVGKQLAFGLISKVEFSLVDEEGDLGNPRAGGRSRSDARVQVSHALRAFDTPSVEYTSMSLDRMPLCERKCFEET